MKFPFLFGFLLRNRILNITDNLSKMLQSQSMSAVEAQHIAELTVKTVQGMRTDDTYFRIGRRTNPKELPPALPMVAQTFRDWGCIVNWIFPFLPITHKAMCSRPMFRHYFAETIATRMTVRQSIITFVNSWSGT